IPVKIDYKEKEIDLLTMKQNQPVFSQTIEPDKIIKVINTDQIDTRFPIQNISTGIQHTLIPLKSLEAIKNVSVNQEELVKLLESTGSIGIFLFTSETYNEKNDINARMFFYPNRVAEDPVTGSANGCLNAYLLKHNYCNSSRIDIRVEQGFEISRDGIIYLKGEKKENSYEIFVGGKVFPVAECRLI
ncbi:PhzF family phenazine biosynthesis protein, partial [candidate division KSB1 bacterium]